MFRGIRVVVTIMIIFRPLINVPIKLDTVFNKLLTHQLADKLLSHVLLILHNANMQNAFINHYIIMNNCPTINIRFVYIAKYIKDRQKS